MKARRAKDNQAFHADYSMVCFYADLLGDYERTRIANENRLRTLTQPVEKCGKAIPPMHPDALTVRAHVDTLAELEKEAVKMLERTLKKMPLGAFVLATPGLGLKTVARFLGIVGNPSRKPIMPAEDQGASIEHPTNQKDDEPSGPLENHEGNGRPNIHSENQPISGTEFRRLGQLYAYCGLHVWHDKDCPASKPIDCPSPNVASAARGKPKHRSDNHNATGCTCNNGRAPKGEKGRQSNWSTEAKTRAYLMAESCIKAKSSPYRAVYDHYKSNLQACNQRITDHAKSKTNKATFYPSGSVGKPKPGDFCTKGHMHRKAMRYVMKKILKDLWLVSQGLEASSVATDNRGGCDANRPPVNQEQIA